MDSAGNQDDVVSAVSEKMVMEDKMTVTEVSSASSLPASDSPSISEIVEIPAPQHGTDDVISTDQPSPVELDQSNMAAPCESCSACAAFEFQPENVAPLHSNRWLFLRSQWEVPWGLYIVYRVGIAIMFSVWVVADFADEAGSFYSDNYAIWLIFATNWSFLLLGVSAVCNAAITTAYFLKDRQLTVAEKQEAKLKEESEQTCISIPIMALWIIYNTAANGAFVVTISYWGFLVSVDQAGFLITTMSRLKHTLNTLYVIFELSFNAIPIRIFHVVYPLFLGAIYTVFNAMYFINHGVGPGGRPYAYYVMDWRNPIESAFTCSMGFVMTTLVQGLMYGIYRLRVYLHSKAMGTNYSALVNENDIENAEESEVEGILGCRSRTNSYSSTEQIELEGVDG